MKVTVDTAGRLGPLVKYVVIHSNDAAAPMATLTLIMEVTKGSP